MKRCTPEQEAAKDMRFRASSNPKYRAANNGEDRRLEFCRANMAYKDWRKFIIAYNKGFLPSWGGHTCFSIHHTPGGGKTTLTQAKKIIPHAPEPAPAYTLHGAVERDISPTITKPASSRQYILCECGHRREVTDYLDYEEVITSHCEYCQADLNPVEQILLMKRSPKREVL
jgi:hypothetical protein